MQEATMLSQIPATESTIRQFNRMVQELLRGGPQRNQFQSWEVGLLLDIEECVLPPGRRFEVLRRYQRAVNRAYEDGEPEVLMLSQYLNRCRRKKSPILLAPGNDVSLHHSVV
jgi:hypothetical protein